MVDGLILLATGLACIYVAIMATYRDRLTPWFPKPEAGEKNGRRDRPEAAGAGRRPKRGPPGKGDAGKPENDG